MITLLKKVDSKRAKFLFLAGGLFVLIGVANIMTPKNKLDEAFYWLEQWSTGAFNLGLTPNVLGWLWVIAGIVAMYAALYNVNTTLTAVGFASLIIPPVLWSFIFLISAIQFENPTGMRGALTHFTLMSFILFVSGWNDPTNVKISVTKS